MAKQEEINAKIDVINSIAEEIVIMDELKGLLANKSNPVAYDGFEPSGKMHIAQGLMRVATINKLTGIGFKFKVFVADWHAMANNKLGGDINKIQTVGKYFIEIWKSAGLNTSNVEFIWASNIVKDPDYWMLVLKIGMLNSITRLTRCSQIMGRSEKDTLSGAQIMYPCMQAADIFYLGIDIAQLGVDQRKVNVLAREIAPKLGFAKPIIISHHMVMGLKEPPKESNNAVERATQLKMSKSDPNSAIFMTDTAKEVDSKIKKAYCPEGVIKDNPVLEYCKYIVFPKLKTLLIERPEKHGGNASYNSYSALEDEFKNKKLHPLDLKIAVAKAINSMLEPVRVYFENNKQAKALLDKVNSF